MLMQHPDSHRLFLFGIQFFCLILGIGSSEILWAQNVAINVSGLAGNSSAILDVEADNKGLLIPRVSLTSVNDVVTITSPATSLLVYNIATSGSVPNNVVPDFYYWNGLKWISFKGQIGVTGAIGANGSDGIDGAVGATGASGTNGVFAFADFYALMPSDNAATVGVGAAVLFPQNGPTDGVISRSSAGQFNLPTIGTYLVNWQLSINEPGQLVLEINGVENLTTIVGRATGTNQLSGSRLITTASANSILRVVNPVGNSTALTLTPFAGGVSPVSASLVITQIQ